MFKKKKTVNLLIMKRLIVFILIALFMCGLNWLALEDFDIQSVFDGAYVEVYTANDSGLDGFSKIKNGAGEIIFSDTSNLKYILNNVEECGYTIKVSKRDFNDVLAALNVSKFTSKNGTVYGYRAGLFATVRIDGELFNLQMAVVNDTLNIGVPLLLGSY